MQVIKRDGSEVPYDHNRIVNAMSKARDSVAQNISDNDIWQVANTVLQAIGEREKITVEEIQDIVELKLMEYGLYEVARHYVLYRHKHKIRREAGTRLMDTYKEIFFTDADKADFKRSNANINTNSSMGQMLSLGTEGAKYFVDNYVLPKEIAEADREKWIHIHDKDFSLITLNCCQIDLLKLFKGGFSTGHGYLREPNSIRSYAALACIAIQSNQNDMFGGQSINAFDYAMGDGVRKSFKKALLRELERSCFYTGDYYLADFDELDEASYGNPKTVDMLAKLVSDKIMARRIYAQACADVEEETKQAMEALIHNFNTLHSRAGAQVPFSSINYGMDTSPEGRLVIREVLNAIDAGLGNGETPIFPISVFQLKDGVNYSIGDPNYDLFKLACRVSAKRLFPNFVNLDAPYNAQYYKPDDYNSYVATIN